MPIIGFNFTKIEVERKKPVSGQIKINNNVTIKKVENDTLFMGGSKKPLARIIFEYSVNYDPQIGGMTLIGNVLFMDDPNKLKKIITNWQKNKKLPEEIMVPIMNTILIKCNIRALNYAEEVNLPHPIRLPRVTKQESSSYVG